MGRPGMMLYFDVLKPFRLLSHEERGKLILAMLEYARDGKEPDFQEELSLLLAWEFVMPKIDCDAGRYEDVVAKRKYAGFCSALARKDREPVSFEEWLEMDEIQRRQMLKGERQDTASADICIPTTAANTTTETNTNTKTESNSNSTSIQKTEPAEAVCIPVSAGAEPELQTGIIKLKGMYEKMKRGGAGMTQLQLESVLCRLGQAKAERYLLRLEQEEARTGESIQNDYARIMRWYLEEDCR